MRVKLKNIVYLKWIFQRLIFILCFFLGTNSYSGSWGTYTLYSLKNGTTAQLIDLNNTVYHTWNFASTKKTGYSCYMLPGGTLVRSYLNSANSLSGGGITGGVQKVDWSGTVIWDFPYSSTTYCLHHDICPLPNGNVLMISYDVKTSAEASAAGCSSAISMWSEKIIEVQPTGTNTGTIVWEWKVWDHLCQSVNSSKSNYVTSISQHPELININYNVTQDFMHMNGLDYNEDLNQITFSAHMLNEMYIIDHSTTSAQAASHSGGNSGKGGDILYRWGNPAAYGMSGTANFNVIHDAHFIPEGNPKANYLCGFNNKGGTGSKSAFDIFLPPYNGYNYNFTTGSPYLPTTYAYRYTWSGTATQNEGNSQQLPNGNTLMNLALTGYIVEVDSNGSTVWTKTLTGSTSHAYRYSSCYTAGTIADAPTITNSGSYLSSSSGTTYQWFFNGIPINGATSQNYTPTKTGNYRVQITNSSGCESKLSTKYYFEISSFSKPEVASVTVTIPEDSSFTNSYPIVDSDVGDIFTSSILKNVSHGNANVSVIGGNLEVSYSPTANYFGKDTLKIIITDSHTLKDTAVIPINVTSVPDYPQIEESSIITDEDTPTNKRLNITDADGDIVFTYNIIKPTINGISQITLNSKVLSINYSPNSDFFGKDTLIVVIKDNSGLSDTANIPITVNAVNDAPTINSMSIITKMNTKADIQCEIIDVDNDKIFNYSILKNSNNGTSIVLIASSKLTITYTPNKDFVGQDSLILKICDNSNLCCSISIPIIVNQNAHNPVIESIALTVLEDSTNSKCTTITDIDGDKSFTYKVIKNSSNGVSDITLNNSNLCLNYSPKKDFYGLDSIKIEVFDVTKLSDTILIPINVTPFPDSPILKMSEIFTHEDTTISVCKDIIDPDDNESFTANFIKNSLNYNATFSLVGKNICLNIKTNLTYQGKDTLYIQICDNSGLQGLCDTAIVPVTVYSLTDVNELVNKEINIFPNPTNGIINLSNLSIDKVNEIALFNIFGEKIKNFNISESINVTNIENGVYLLRIYTNEIVYFTKIILMN